MIRKREGFTLVELLVVIAIIIILAAILFPIFARARDKAQHTRCLNNMKQMGAAFEMYEDDYEGTICPVSIGAGIPGGETATSTGLYWGYMWGDLVNPYLKQLKRGKTFGQTSGQGDVFQCPSAPTEEMTSGNTWQGGKTIGYNPYLTRTTTSTMVKYPSLTLRVTETANYVFDPHQPLPGSQKDYRYKGGSWYCPLPSEVPIAPGTFGYGFSLYSPGWHSGMSDVLWVDGHVSSMPWERVMYTDKWQSTTDVNVWCRLAPKEGYTPEG